MIVLWIVAGAALLASFMADRRKTRMAPAAEPLGPATAPSAITLNLSKKGDAHVN